MAEIVLNDPNILRIMSKAFDGLDEIRIQTGDGFRIFGVNKASTAYYNLFIQTPFYHEKEKGVTISTESFNTLLELALSEYLKNFKKLSISIVEESHTKFIITGEYTEIDETLIHIPLGIKTEPPQIKTLDFSKAAICKVKSPVDYKLVHKHFDGISKFVTVDPIEISITQEEIEFNPLKQRNHLHKLKGRSKGNAKSLISLPNIKLTSGVADLKGITGLEIFVIDKAIMKFKYSFNSGFLEYIVPPTIEPES